ncbi:beta-ketoacyl synthase N-terminal-like domain-containing protein [Flavivirga amylovorans]|uniref:Beta-ketoacyl synthase N-terminal-like domain-containing protein n=1 Tax=Flavivirga amylovorans TaxID=870486 RepID=A0ABT8WZ54_9FLAO|nr:beta-ketoacyl synthase N-terminal-like domain-containing protein [Flavivirga amylovorans]MDO5986957.1 beta-ketoacyl synthase N-terminal-like domain-containing protein [Flavivirga amylovorans]
MTEVYLSYNNIVSSLGFDSETVVDNIHNQVSGLQLIDDKNLLPQPFYSSIINTKALSERFEYLKDKDHFTRLEQMMITSLNNVIQSSKIPLNKNVGLIISTTKGNIDVLDKNSKFPKERAYLSVLGKKIKDFFGFKNDAIVISNACVSGVLAVAVAKRYINQGVYDHVFIVSGDIVTEFILSGFNSFQALSNAPCKPYCKNRSGINIGEVAASMLVTNNKISLAKEAVTILGEGSCNDANHISGPSRTGEGLFRSITSALKEANISHESIDYISAHGTATPYNDEMEAIAFNRLGLQDVPINSLKGYFGHTLGASGLLETIVGMHSLYNNTLYPSLGFETLGVTQPINIITKITPKKMNFFLKTASGFGGSNTAVIFKKVKKDKN